MSETKKVQTGINNISEEWFRAKIDRKTLKKLSKRSIEYFCLKTTSLYFFIKL